MILNLRELKIELGRFRLNIDLQDLEGGVIGIFGPSGSGKTTLLEVVAGIRPPETAFISVDGFVLTDTSRQIQVPIERRAIGYVPQDLALFPHLSVRQNILFSRHGDAGHDFSHIVDVLEIGELLDRGISNLSGGEKQRVTFARALLASPRLLLLDEPLASLNRSLKKKMAQYLLRLCEEFKIPMLYVSHDEEEIIDLCDEVVVLQDGSVTARGEPLVILKQER